MKILFTITTIMLYVVVTNCGSDARTVSSKARRRSTSAVRDGNVNQSTVKESEQKTDDTSQNDDTSQADDSSQADDTSKTDNATQTDDTTASDDTPPIDTATQGSTDASPIDKKELFYWLKASYESIVKVAGYAAGTTVDNDAPCDKGGKIVIKGPVTDGSTFAIKGVPSNCASTTVCSHKDFTANSGNIDLTAVAVATKKSVVLSGSTTFGNQLSGSCTWNFTLTYGSSYEGCIGDVCGQDCAVYATDDAVCTQTN